MSILAGISCYLPYPLAARLLQEPARAPAGMGERYPAAVLFADLAGFTPLAEMFGRAGREGGEELTNLLNHYFTTLIAPVEAWGGFAGKFAGDALVALFAGPSAASRAAACAVDVLEVGAGLAGVGTSLGPFTLRLKLGLAYGEVLQAVVGDDWRSEFVFAGRPLDDAAAAEHHAGPGDAILHASILAELPGDEVEAVPLDAGFARLRGLRRQPVRAPLPPLPAPIDPRAAQEALRPYLPGPVYERLLLGLPAFAHEHRRVTVLFVNFAGIDYAALDAAQCLNDYLKDCFRAVAGLDGYVRQVDMGDKGSKFIILFGAPVAHENDEERALLCALPLQDLAAARPGITTQSIGVTTGLVFAGSVGSPARKEYAAIGDAVNLSARLMQAAAPGQVLVDEATRRAAGDTFAWDELAPIQVKGKREPVAVYDLRGRLHRRAHLRGGAGYALPMVGRAAELARLRGLARQVRAAGRGCAAGVAGEAGLGKTRLVAELVRDALEAGFTGLGGNGLSHGTTTPYLAWRPVLRGLLDIDEGRPLAEQVAEISARLHAAGTDLPARMPLLSDVLGERLPDNDVTAAFDAGLRRESLFSLVLDVLRWRAHSAPLLLVLEDAHWFDDLSLALARAVAATITGAGRALPVFLVVVYRPAEIAGHAGLREAFPTDFEEVALGPFTPDETGELIARKLAGRAVPPALIERIERLAQGNPFFVDELANLVAARAACPEGTEALATIEMPDSIEGLIVSRLDQLAESEQMTLRVASVIGQLFRAKWLLGAYPGEIREELLRRDLDRVTAAGLLDLSQAEPELEYLFRHVITQEVVYGTLSFANRRMLHERVAAYITSAYADQGPWHGILAFHYGRAGLAAQEYACAVQAAVQAARQSAYRQALAFNTRALELIAAHGLGTPREEFDLHERRLSQAEVLGEFDLQQQDAAALEMLAAGLDPRRRVRASFRRGALARRIGRNEESVALLEEAAALAKRHGDPLSAVQALTELGEGAFDAGDYPRAKAFLGQAVAQAEEAILRDHTRALRLLGWIAYDGGNYDETARYWNESLDLSMALGDRPQQAMTLCNLGTLYDTQYHTAKGIAYIERGLALATEIGAVSARREAYRVLAGGLLGVAQYERAWECYEQMMALLDPRTDAYDLSYGLCRMAEVVLQSGGELSLADELSRRSVEQGVPAHKELMGWVWYTRGRVLAAMGDYPAAREALETSLSLRREVGQALIGLDTQSDLVELYLHTGDLPAAQRTAAEMLAILQPAEGKIAEEPASWFACYRVLLASGEPDRARACLQQAYDMLLEIAGRIGDEDLRRSFLERSPQNRQIVAAGASL